MPGPVAKGGLAAEVRFRVAQSGLGRSGRRALLALGAGLLLAGLAACAGSPEKELSVTAPAGDPAGQAMVSEGELPEPQAESPEIAAGAAESASSDEEPASIGVEPATGSAVEPALSGEPALRGEAALSGQAAAGEGAALPVPRPPAEPRKPPAEKSPPASQPAKSAKAPKAPTPPPAPAAVPAKPGPSGGAPASEKAAAEGPRAAEPREVLARKGDTVVIDLEGRGWLLLPGDRRGVSFLGSESGPQRTSFSFKALELGDYELAFQLQDNARGAVTGELVRLRVLSEEKLREMLAAPPKAGSAPESADPARLEKAEKLFAGGFFDLALPEYLAIYREADPLLNDRLAAIYLAKGEAAAAAKFYDRNLSAAAPYGRQAVIGLVRAGRAMASPELVLQYLPELLELPPSETQAELLGVARFAASQGLYPLALELLTEFLRRHPRGAELDTVYFQLARLYELESPLRDVRLARYYYSKLYEDFPESEHAAEARSRILYLDRHFFHVQ